MTTLFWALLFALGIALCFDWLTRPLPAPAPGARVALLRPLRDRLARAGVREAAVRLDVFLLLTLGAGLGVAFVTQVIAGWSVVSLALGLVGASLPLLFYSREAERRGEAVQAALVEAIGQLRDANRAGHTIGPGLELLATHGPVLLRPAFARLVRDSYQVGFQRAVTTWQDELADPLADTVATTLRLADRTGGDALSEVLDQLARATRGEQRTLREQRAHQARTKVQARVIAVMPLLLLVSLKWVSPAYMAVFDGGGQVVLLVCLLLIVAGYAAMLRLGRIDGAERTLRP